MKNQSSDSLRRRYLSNHTLQRGIRGGISLRFSMRETRISKLGQCLNTILRFWDAMGTNVTQKDCKPFRISLDWITEENSSLVSILWILSGDSPERICKIWIELYNAPFAFHPFQNRISHQKTSCKVFTRTSNCVFQGFWGDFLREIFSSILSGESPERFVYFLAIKSRSENVS